MGSAGLPPERETTPPCLPVDFFVPIFVSRVKMRTHFSADVLSSSLDVG